MDLLNAQEASIVKMRMQIAKLVGVEATAAQAAAKEETFTCLKFEPQQGAKIGLYEVAYKANNVEDKWTQAFNILRQSNATINSRPTDTFVRQSETRPNYPNHRFFERKIPLCRPCFEEIQPTKANKQRVEFWRVIFPVIDEGGF